ncbi:MAG TPA: purine-nucleoside phosphorylase [Candidatus Eisenbacteria bacterium]|jgi:purine-nucleoside phosphorylase|nr:purine-nucleoside phosphorylase [Candidatus Eisenbacteria bacterium]
MPIKTASTSAEFTNSTRAAKFIHSKTKLRPRIALVLGSGLGAFADDFASAIRIPYAKIPHFPRSTAIGHAGQLVIGKVGDVPVAGMQGRVHLYEGYSAKDVAFPIRVFQRMGVKAVILTNAAGGINLTYSEGALVILRDHINLQPTNPLIGANDDRFGLRFPDMTRAYDSDFRSFAAEEGKKLRLDLHEGVYLALGGPNYETPAEIHAFRTLGADLVGMSTVPEVLAARHSNIRVLGISCVTNMAAGITGAPLTAEEVFATGARIKNDFIALLRAVIPRISASI